MLNVANSAAEKKICSMGQFFQPESHFEHLRTIVLPNRKGEGLRIWHAGCSTGEGTYGLSMLIDDHLGSAAKWEIVATDADAVKLETAKLGQYGRDAVEAIPAAIREAYFRLGTRGCGRNRFVVNQRLRQRIYFVQLSIYRMLPPFESFDVIIVQDPPRGSASLRSVDHLIPLLRPGGYMFLENVRVSDSPALLEIDSGFLVRTFESPAEYRLPRSCDTQPFSPCGQVQRAYLYGLCSET